MNKCYIKTSLVESDSIIPLMNPIRVAYKAKSKTAMKTRSHWSRI